jgi:uncharacterized membrane protein YdjX (TVP38/TMEM64 family)
MRLLRRLAPVVVLAGAGAAVALLVPHSPSGMRALLLDAGAMAPLVALAAWMLLTPALFPGTLLAAACGLAFGATGGAALALAGAVAGGLTAFALGRTVARRPVERLVGRHPRLGRLHGRLERDGFAAVLATRLMPGVPATWLHYAAGASPVRLRAFAAAIAVGALLRVVPYALLGQGLGSGSLATLAVAAASIVVGGLAAVVLVRRLRAAPAPA